MKRLKDPTSKLCWRIGVVVCLLGLSGCAGKHIDGHVKVPELTDGQVTVAQPDSLSQKESGEFAEPGPDIGVKQAGNDRERSNQPPHSAKSGGYSGQVEKAADKKTADINLETLTERLKETPAIGVFTKLAIHSDIIDLKDEIKTYKRKSVLQSKIESVRAKFDGLLMKIIALLEADPDLSRDLYTARESIWKSLLGVTT